MTADAAMAGIGQGEDLAFMELALTLGRRGRGRTWPNPFVGAVVVRREADGPVILGRGVTSATVTTTDERALVLAHRFRADVESMEGFAVLRAAQVARIPAIEIRGVSNIVGNRANNGWNFDAGAEAAVATTDALIDVLLQE